MATPEVNTIEEGDEYYHVQFRDPDLFSTIRTPDWASDAADSVLDGAKVRTGKESDDDEWLVESVLVPLDTVGEDEAESSAREVVEKIES